MEERDGGEKKTESRGRGGAGWAVMGPLVHPFVPSLSPTSHSLQCTRGNTPWKARVDSLTLSRTEGGEVSEGAARRAGEELGELGCHGADGREECTRSVGGEAAHGREGTTVGARADRVEQRGSSTRLSETIPALVDTVG